MEFFEPERKKHYKPTKDKIAASVRKAQGRPLLEIIAEFQAKERSQSKTIIIPKHGKSSRKNK